MDFVNDEMGTITSTLGECVRDVFAIYDNNISPGLLMIIIKIIILYFIQIRHTDDFPPTGTPANTDINLLIFRIAKPGQSRRSTPDRDKGLCKEFFPQKPEITMEVGGWVQVSLGFFLFGKSSQNSPNPVLIFWITPISIPCVFCLTLIKVVGYYDLSDLSMSVMGFQKNLDGGWALFNLFLKCLTLQRP